MQTIKCARDMSTHIANACAAPDCEHLVFEASKYSPTALCNELWITAKNLYWALAKVEAVGDVGATYVVMSNAEYNARAIDRHHA